jgi:phenylalanyl-tRNA synthetase beta chain
MRPHPQKSGLRLVTVDRGGGTQQEIVCGAPNVPEPGGLVVLAPLGTHLPAKGMTIEPRSIGGIPSEGMLCSESELGLGDDGDGILILDDAGLEPGMPLAKAIPSTHDVVFEIGLTPNRPDCLGHAGLAREISALYVIPFSLSSMMGPSRTSDESFQSLNVEIDVQDQERCPHYGAAALIDVKVAPSPRELRYRLSSLGVRPISNIVDLTNLLMLKFGHPMHAFDLDRVHDNTIVVRRAKDGEILRTLDGVDRKLVSDDLVICDGRGPVALAGVMGGASSEITAETTRVFYECAYFEPRGVRRTARRHGMHTESSHRFERGVDRSGARRVLSAAVALTTQIVPSARAVYGQIHVEKRAEPTPPVTLRHARIESILGTHVPWGEATGILTVLGCGVGDIGSGVAEVTLPSHRPDLAREIDLIEEVARVRGMDKIPEELPAIRPCMPVGGAEELVRRVRAAAVAQGLSEAVTYAFTSEESLAKAQAPAPTVRLQNPLGAHHAVMRTSLLPGLAETSAHARRHGERDMALFTIGSTYTANASGLPTETPFLTALLVGHRAGYLQKAEPFDVFDAKAVAEGIVHALTGATPTLVRKEFPELHPRGAAEILLDGESIGRLGPLHPDVLESFDLGEHAVALTLDVRALGRPRTFQYRPLPKFPAATRDLALVVHDDVRAGDVQSALRAVAGPLAEELELFDRFVGTGVPKDHASLAFRVVYRASDRTLTDTEVDAAHTALVKEAQARFGAQLRG